MYKYLLHDALEGNYYLSNSKQGVIDRVLELVEYSQSIDELALYKVVDKATKNSMQFSMVPSEFEDCYEEPDFSMGYNEMLEVLDAEPIHYTISIDFSE